MINYLHTPVMLPEVLKWFSCFDENVYVDATIGGAGHGKAIIEKILPNGRLVGIDCDKDAILASERCLEGYSENLILVHDNFRSIKKIWEELKLPLVDGVLFDLGVSLYQLKEMSRGFSFREPGPLDMRLDRNQKIKAFNLVNYSPEEELSRIIFSYGEERWSRKIAKAIVFARNKKPVETTTELAEIISKVVPYNRIHPATRTFQAIRIAVNDELKALEEGLAGALEILKVQGRIIVLTYHSLEDRIVKNVFRNIAKEGNYLVLTKKPLRPSLEEMQENPSSRSAKMRVIERKVSS